MLPHTADAAIAAWGDTLAELFEQTAAGMYAVMIENPESVHAVETRHLQLSAGDADHLLVAWLLELLFLTETDALLCRGSTVTIEDGRVLRADVTGERLDPSRHHVGSVVKAVALHGLHIERDGPRYRVEVLFDI